MVGIIVAILVFVATAIIGAIFKGFMFSYGWYVLGSAVTIAAIWLIQYVVRSFQITRRFNQMTLRDLQRNAPEFREHDAVGSDTIATFGLEAKKWLEILLRRTFKETRDFPTDYTLLVTQYIRYIESLKHYVELVIDWSSSIAIDLDKDGESSCFDMRGKSYQYEELVTQLTWLDNISEEHDKFTRDFETPLSLPSWREDSLLVAKQYSREEVQQNSRLNAYFDNHEVMSIKCKPLKLQNKIERLTEFINRVSLEHGLGQVGSAQKQPP